VEKGQRMRTAAAGVVSVSTALSHRICQTAAGFWTVARPGPIRYNSRLDASEDLVPPCFDTSLCRCHCRRAAPWGSDRPAGSCRSSAPHHFPPPSGPDPRAACPASRSHAWRQLFQPRFPRPRQGRPMGRLLLSLLTPLRRPGDSFRGSSGRRRPVRACGCGWTGGAPPRSSSSTRPPSSAAPACLRATYASSAPSSPTPPTSLVSERPQFDTRSLLLSKRPRIPEF
jgi:hypothetical protein